MLQQYRNEYSNHLSCSHSIVFQFAFEFHKGFLGAKHVELHVVGVVGKLALMDLASVNEMVDDVVDV